MSDSVKKYFDIKHKLKNNKVASLKEGDLFVLGFRNDNTDYYKIEHKSKHAIYCTRNGGKEMYWFTPSEKVIKIFNHEV